MVLMAATWREAGDSLFNIAESGGVSYSSQIWETAIEMTAWSRALITHIEVTFASPTLFLYSFLLPSAIYITPEKPKTIYRLKARIYLI